MNIGDKIEKPVLTQEECDNYAGYAKWCNENNAHIEDKDDYYEIVENVTEEHIPTTAEQIASLKAELATYDYIGVKIAMGVANADEYAEQIAYTETLRAKINELQATESDTNE